MHVDCGIRQPLSDGSDFSGLLLAAPDLSSSNNPPAPARSAVAEQLCLVFRSLETEVSAL